jgi:hypothetical protein
MLEECWCQRNTDAGEILVPEKCRCPSAVKLNRPISAWPLPRKISIEKTPLAASAQGTNRYPWMGIERDGGIADGESRGGGLVGMSVRHRLLLGLPVVLKLSS